MVIPDVNIEDSKKEVATAHEGANTKCIPELKVPSDVARAARIEVVTLSPSGSYWRL
jgi:hypothetical protein